MKSLVLRRFPRAACAVLLLAAGASFAANPYLQKALQTSFGSLDGAILVVDPRSGESFGAIHPEVLTDRKYPPGSLIKVFTTIAYAVDHGEAFPQYECPRTLATDPEGCWDRNGHGEVRLEKALAYSCNVYFRQLASRVEPATFASVLEKYGLVDRQEEFLDLPESTRRRVMVGNTLDFRIEPARILRAYCALFGNGALWSVTGNNAPESVPLPSAPVLDRLRAGLRAGGAAGTSSLAGKAAGVELLGKTGTSLQAGESASWERTQGWWIGLYPTDRPEIAVLTFVRTGRGAADAAPLGGRVLAEYLRMRDGKHR